MDCHGLADYRGQPRALFVDFDGTLTSAGRLRASTYAAMEQLAQRVPLVIVTGRPAGWGQGMAAAWPVAAVIAENGAVTFRPERHFALDEGDLPGLRERMMGVFEQVRRQFPRARLSGDSDYRQVDLAIDWNERVSLAADEAEQIARLFRAQGFNATRSSVHVNVGPIGVDKLGACKVLIAEMLRGDANDLEPYLYVGDALNDAPMFGGFPHSVGVANVREVWDELPHKPRYVTEAAEGAGFEELARHLLD